MSDERKQSERATESLPEDLESELAKVDEKVTNNSLRIARFVVQKMILRADHSHFACLRFAYLNPQEPGFASRSVNSA